MPASNELLQEGRYRINQPVSGDGNVYEEYDTVRNIKVLVREFPVRLNAVATVSQRETIKLAFANQAKALSEIDHESLLHVQDYFSEIDRQYLVMESVEGEDLNQILTRNKKPFLLDSVLRWADDLLDALHYLHSHKPSIIHRNIRPENIRLHSSGKVKLLGVGLDSGTDAEFAGSPADGSELKYSPMEQIWPGLDAASQKVITHTYDDRSERILKEPLDACSDIYSLGATLYFLMTGLEPVDPLERSIDLLEGKLDPLREPTKVDSNIPAEISDVLMKSLEIKRENRYDSALIMRQVLKTAVTRVEEREAQDAREQDEAAEVIRRAAQPKITAPPEVDHEAAAAEKRRQDEMLQRQLREAEQQRVFAEQKAAEAERMRSEEEKSAATVQTVPEENLLEIPAAPEVVAYRENPEVDETELAAVLEELEKAELELQANKVGVPEPTHVEVAKAEASDDDFEDEAEHVQVYEEPIDLAPETEPSVEPSTHEGLFAATEQPRSSLPMPAIAGAIGLVLVIAVGGWFALSGSSEPAPTVSTPAMQVAQPALPQTSPTAEAITPTEPQPETAAATEADLTEDQAAAPKAAPAAKPKKTEAKSVAEKKKAVTVDDLINDN